MRLNPAKQPFLTATTIQCNALPFIDKKRRDKIRIYKYILGMVSALLIYLSIFVLHRSSTMYLLYHAQLLQKRNP